MSLTRNLAVGDTVRARINGKVGPKHYRIERVWDSGSKLYYGVVGVHADEDGDLKEFAIWVDAEHCHKVGS